MSTGEGAVILVGRVLFAIFFLRSSWGHLTKRDRMITVAKKAKLPAAYLAGWPSAVWLFAGSISVVLGIWPDIGSLMLGVFVVPATLYFHRFWTFEDPVQKQTQTTNFYRNVEILGASLVMFGLFASLGHALRFALTGSLIKW
jgi:putative oxidoreductase